MQRHTRFIQYPSQHGVFRFLDEILADPRGIGLLHGRESSGKSDLIEQIAVKVRERCAVAVIDGARLKPTEFLSEALSGFGYDLELASVDELLSMFSVFAVQQSMSREAPVLILENFNRMYPSTLSVLCKLATLRANSGFALRVILVADHDFRRVIEAPGMDAILTRLAGDFELQPLTARESLVYLYAELQSLGIAHPDAVFTSDVATELHAATGGWPGKLDAVAAAIVQKADRFPIRFDELHAEPEQEDVPTLIVSRNGEIVREVRLEAERTLVGRSEMSDVVLDHIYVSKHHALFVRKEDAVILVDLKSRNGSFVNSRLVSNKVLRDSDIISIGEYRLKMIYPEGFGVLPVLDPELADTARMKSIADARRARAVRELGRVDPQQKKA